MDNVKDKIRKLLAKATSNNEHEAQAALLKARELMARYKLTEEEVGDAPTSTRKLKRARYEDRFYSDDRRSWYHLLGSIIAENHCCECLVNNQKGRKKRYVCFIGLDDDPDICLEIFTYAIRHIEDRVKLERGNISPVLILQPDLKNRYIKVFENSYAKGFSIGLKNQYEEQFIQPDNESLGLIMTIPQEVTDYTATLGKIDLKMEDTSILEDAYREGKDAGYTFNPIKQLWGGMEDAS